MRMAGSHLSLPNSVDTNPGLIVIVTIPKLGRLGSSHHASRVAFAASPSRPICPSDVGRSPLRDHSKRRSVAQTPSRLVNVVSSLV